MIARALSFSWLRVRREPGRTALAVLGVTAIGALLFDMLLLSNGLLVSFRMAKQPDIVPSAAVEGVAFG